MYISFKNWIESYESQRGVQGGKEPPVQGYDLYSAREGIKNGMANMRSDPSKTLADALQWGLNKVRGHKRAESIIRSMQDEAKHFFNQILTGGYGWPARHQGLGIYDNYGDRPRMPNEGEQGYEEYQQMYLKYYDKLNKMWNELNRLAHRDASGVPDEERRKHDHQGRVLDWEREDWAQRYQV